MNKDFRVSVTLPTHPKTIKLMRKLGDRSFYCLVRLWAQVAQIRPNGVLSGMDVDDIEIAADWQGEPGVFVGVLENYNFLSRDTDNNLVMHDWEDYQGHCIGAKDRSDRGKVNALIKHYGRKEGLRRAKETLKIDIQALGYKTDSDSADSNAGSTADSMPIAERAANEQQCCDMPHSYAPSPSPSPYPDPSKKSRDGPAGGLPADSSKPIPRNKSSGHWSNNVGDWFESILGSARDLERLSQTSGKKFNPWQMIQHMVNEKYHPGAVAEIMGKLVTAFPNINGNVYQYTSAFKKTVKQNWNEKEAIEIHDQFKNMDPGELAEITKGLLSEI